MALIVGIDLGTTYTVISYIDQVTKEPRIIKNKKGNNTTPSVIGFTSENEYVIGEEAKSMEEVGNVNTASFYKLHMGDHGYKVTLYGKEYTARELSGLFLKRLIEDAEQTMREKISRAVITVPAYFEEAAKNDTIAAGQAAGLEVMNIINEPTAACVAYGLKEDGSDKKILIYDLGGGTFDVTVAEVKKDSISVKGTIGHHSLGGRDWDGAIADWLAERYLDETGIDISEDSEASAENMIKAEIAKRQLTSSIYADISVGSGKDKRKFRLTRHDFEELTSYLLNITTDLIDQLFDNIHITWHDIDGAVLVGGSTKMPMVRNFIAENNIRVLDGVHPDEAVAIGAAIQANISSFCATLTSRKEIKSSLAMKKDELDLARLPGAKLIVDVIPHSLGMIVESADRSSFVNDIMIPRNTPCQSAKETKRRELRVSRKKENNHLDIYLLQGESTDPVNCSVAKKYCFYDIDYVGGGKTLLDITFMHTINGTIDISATQTENGKQLKFREEPIPDDMSWIEQKPTEIYGGSETSVSGALVMALDLSGSMSLEVKPGVTALDSAKQAMMNFVDQFSDHDIDIGIIGFSDKSKVYCHPSSDHKKAKSAIGHLKSCDTGICNDADPLPLIYSELEKYRNEPFVYALVLTDGVWDPNACADAVNMKKKYEKSDMEIIGMGFGQADCKFLKRISTRDELANVDDIANLNSNLSSIARIILE